MGDRAATGGYDPSGIDIDAWEKLELQLEETIPNYDRVNRLMTFGQDKRWRRNVRNHATPGMKILEVGCGPGSFAEDLVGLDVTCLDPSSEMLKVAKKRLPKKLMFNMKMEEKLFLLLTCGRDTLKIIGPSTGNFIQ